MPNDIPLTKELLDDIRHLKPSEQRKVYSLIGAQEFSKCADDLLYWLDKSKHPIPYVYTQDQKPLYQCNMCMSKGIEATTYFHKLGNHLKIKHNIECERSLDQRGYFTELPTTRPFPMKPYIEPIANTWLTEQFLFIPKSRDMIATWQIVAYYTWDAIHHRGRQIFFQSENATKANYLIQRANFIYKNQPIWLRSIHKAEYTLNNKSGRLFLPTLDSEIIGLAQGPDQIRMHHPSGIFLDEMAFQEKAGDTFAAVKPAIQAGGKLTGISSANPGFFHLICEDLLEES